MHQGLGEAHIRRPPSVSDYPPLKSLFSNSLFSLRRHQSGLSRHNAPQLHFCPLTSLFIPPCRILEPSVWIDPTFSLLLSRSSHGCKATHEALHMLFNNLGFERGSQVHPYQMRSTSTSTQTQDIPSSHCHMLFFLIQKLETPNTSQAHFHIPLANHHRVLLRISTLSNFRHL